LGDTAIRIDGVTKSYAGHVAVRDLSLTVPRGSIFGLLGPNGAGKTTTLRMVMDILGPDSGTIEILGRPAGPRGARPHRLHARGARASIPAWCSRSSCSSWPRSRAHRGPRPPAAFRRGWSAGPPDWSRRKVIELSKGMQQKAQLVATLLHEPRC
jgi:ABC-2 type transport system ATP-binding protein